MKFLKFALCSIAAAHLFVAAPVIADPDPVFLTESDSGIVFGDLDCKITSVVVDPDVKFSEDPFNNLFATVKSTLVCVDRSGMSHQFSAQDTVWFPTVDFNWQSQQWRFAQTAVAKRNSPYGVVLTPGITAKVWHNVDETHLAFKVELWSE